jgi:hypothetical protein
MGNPAIDAHSAAMLANAYFLFSPKLVRTFQSRFGMVNNPVLQEQVYSPRWRAQIADGTSDPLRGRAVMVYTRFDSCNQESVHTHAAGYRS